MHRFRLLSTEVRAARIGSDGSVTIDGRQLVGDAGRWVVVGEDGTMSTWTDDEFRQRFEPADEPARLYLELSPPGRP